MGVSHTGYQKSHSVNSKYGSYVIGPEYVTRKRTGHSPSIAKKAPLGNGIEKNQSEKSKYLSMIGKAHKAAKNTHKGGVQYSLQKAKKEGLVEWLKKSSDGQEEVASNLALLMRHAQFSRSTVKMIAKVLSDSGNRSYVLKQQPEMSERVREYIKQL